MRIPCQFVSILILTWVVVASCSTPRVPITEVSDSKTAKELGESIIIPEETVDFEGISFQYDPNTFGQVKREVVPEVKLEQPDEKPDSVAPQHIRFEFEFGNEAGNAQIEIYPLEEFPGVYSVSPESVKGMKEEIAGLRRVLKDQSYRLDRRIPHLPFADAGDSFYVKVREFDFPNGDGILFVTHWTHGVELVSNRSLIYRFEGLTADGKYYVTAETPTSVDFLPDVSPEEFEGCTWEDALRNSKERVAKHDEYLKSITTRLEKLNSNDFSPNLNKFEAIISSLRVDK